MENLEVVYGKKTHEPEEEQASPWERISAEALKLIPAEERQKAQKLLDNPEFKNLRYMGLIIGVLGIAFMSRFVLKAIGEFIIARSGAVGISGIVVGSILYGLGVYSGNER
ncbi:MAG: hypothetical protein NTZ97_02315, partial [Candidatus Moranbacteria bacterium]|nr:hypothetical protein [Candidatus Moranbacteria bacterium]